MSELSDEMHGVAGELCNSRAYAGSHQSTLEATSLLIKGAQRIEELERTQITPELRRRVIEMAEIDDDAWADCDHEVRPSVTTLISDLRDAFAATGESDE